MPLAGGRRDVVEDVTQMAPAPGTDGLDGPVYATGGDAPLYREIFDVLVPTLTLEGVAFSYLCWRRS